MSYNIDSVRCLSLAGRMERKVIRRLLKKHRGELPEVNFLEEHRNDPVDADGVVDLRNFWWYGVGSGHAWDLLLKTIAPQVLGAVDALFTWEGGDSHSGLRIRNGAVEECDVKMSLVSKTEKQ